MLEHPPLIETHLTPEQIVGAYNIQALIGHIKNFEQNKEKIGRPVNKEMGEIISRLAEHGYYIDGIDKHGNIDFMVATKGQVQREFEGPVLNRLKEIPLNELQEMGRNGYRQVIRKQEEHKRLKN
jgi:hypothetical protein